MAAVATLSCDRCHVAPSRERASWVGIWWAHQLPHRAGCHRGHSSGILTRSLWAGELRSTATLPPHGPAPRPLPHCSTDFDDTWALIYLLSRPDLFKLRLVQVRGHAMQRSQPPPSSPQLQQLASLWAAPSPSHGKAAWRTAGAHQERCAVAFWRSPRVSRSHHLLSHPEPSHTACTCGRHREPRHRPESTCHRGGGPHRCQV